MSKTTSGTLPAKPVAVQYIGRGAYLPLVPARDMGAAQAAHYWQDLREAEANGQRLYIPATPEQAPATHEPEGE